MKHLLYVCSLIVGMLLVGCDKASDKALAVWDFDGTILDGDCTEGLVRGGKTEYVGLLEACVKAGFAPAYRDAEGLKRFQDEYEALIKAGRTYDAYASAATIFAGADVEEIEAFCRAHFESNIVLHCYAESLARFFELERAGVENHVVSASPDFFVQASTDVLRVDRSRVHGIRVAVKDGKLTDEVLPPVPYAEGKTAFMRELEKASGRKALYGFGNSYGTDGPFLAAIARQGGVSTMINGGKIVSGMTELFVCVDRMLTVESVRVRK